MASVHEAKTHLSKLLEKVELGEVVTVERPKRKVGSAIGAFVVPDDFNAPVQEIEDHFYL